MLTSLVVKNFRSCESLLVRLDEPVIAMVGKNGVGKTNVLHAIDFAAQLCVGSDSANQWRLQPRDISRPVEFALSFSVAGDQFQYVTTRTQRPSQIQTHEELHKNGALLFHRSGEDIRSDLTEGVRVGVRVSSVAALLQLLPIDNPLVSELLPVTGYLSSLKYYPLMHGFVEHTYGPGPRDHNPFIEASRYDGFKAELERGVPGGSVLLRILHMFQTDRDGKFAELCALLGENGLGLVAKVDVRQVELLRPRVSVREEPAAETEPETAYIVNFVPGSGLAGERRSFNNRGLSSGTWRVIQLMTYLVFDGASTMLVEQPEDYIHPGLLAKVIDILMTYSGRTQVICTTHSPRVMNLLGPRAVRMVSAVDGQTLVHELTTGEIGQAEAYITDQGTLAEYLETL